MAAERKRKLQLLAKRAKRVEKTKIDAQAEAKTASCELSDSDKDKETGEKGDESLASMDVDQAAASKTKSHDVVDGDIKARLLKVKKSKSRRRMENEVRRLASKGIILRKRSPVAKPMLTDE